MAGDWVVWVKGLSRKREVLAIAERTGRDRRLVACLLMEFWEWADGETEDGYLPFMSVRNLSASQADTDETFWGHVADVGWLVIEDGGILIPNFSRWMGASAKRRLNDTNRKRQNRVGDVRNLSANCPHPMRTEPGPEKRREEIEENTPLTPHGGACNPITASNGRHQKKPPPEVDLAFGRFWQAYPRKEDRAAAAKAFARLPPTPELLDTILGAIERQKARGCLEPRCGTDGRSVIPYASTWLNKRRWEDEPPPGAAGSPPHANGFAASFLDALGKGAAR